MTLTVFCWLCMLEITVARRLFCVDIPVHNLETIETITGSLPVASRISFETCSNMTRFSWIVPRSETLPVPLSSRATLLSLVDVGLTSRFLLLEKERVLASLRWRSLLTIPAKVKTAEEGVSPAADCGVAAELFTCFGLLWCVGGGGVAENRFPVR